MRLNANNEYHYNANDNNRNAMNNNVVNNNHTNACRCACPQSPRGPRGAWTSIITYITSIY